MIASYFNAYDPYLYVLGILLVVIIILRAPTVPEFVHSHWYHYFPDIQFSANEFYKAVETILVEREIPKTVTSRPIFYETGGWIGPNRIYLRVRNAPYSFDICAATYGTGFFVSWWFGEDIGWFMRIVYAIPVIGPYFRRRAEALTYYILDTQCMFREATRTAVLDALDQVTSTNGKRALTEHEREPRKGMRVSK